MVSLHLQLMLDYIEFSDLNLEHVTHF
jgi:hypothetical protein